MRNSPSSPPKLRCSLHQQYDGWLEHVHFPFSFLPMVWQPPLELAKPLVQRIPPELRNGVLPLVPRVQQRVKLSVMRISWEEVPGINPGSSDKKVGPSMYNGGALVREEEMIVARRKTAGWMTAGCGPV